jgi:hypothetical protein
MPVEMVWGDIQNRGRGRVKRLDELQLKRRCLDDHYLMTGPGDVTEGQPDVAGGDRVASTAVEHCGHGRGDGGLAVGARHRNTGCADVLVTELHFADESNSGVEAVDDRGRIHRDSRAGHDQIAIAQQAPVPVATDGYYVDVEIGEGILVAVVQDHVVAEAPRQTGRGPPRNCPTQNQGAAGREGRRMVHRPTSVTARKSA